MRFYLFANSYAGKRIITYLKTECKKKKLPQQIKRLAVVLDFNFRKVERHIIDDFVPDCPYKRIPKNLKIYLEIESEISNLVEEKLDEYSTALEDYQGKLLSPAFERAVGNLMDNTNDDQEFTNTMATLIPNYNYIYYKVAYEYKIPTLRIVPFVIRLIRS